jgi:hypothetical protein
MKLSLTEDFDLFLLGHQSGLPKKGIDQRIREKYPNLATLKIERAGEPHSVYPTGISDSAPKHVLQALHEMLGDDLELTPIQLPALSGKSPPV